MFRMLITGALFGGSLLVAACNTVEGAADDVKSVAQCTEDMINRGEC